MSLRFILMRHAKSAWDSPAAGDFERPLNKRGRNAATTIGGWLADKGHLPDHVLCSSAERTRETWGLVKGALGTDPEVEFLRSLYLASPETMLQDLSEIQDAAVVLMVAHNPGSAILANALADQAPAHSRFDDYPSAATTVFEFEFSDWASVKPGSGQVVDFIVPRDLAAKNP
ncbi:MAG: histidine phosphatase family protein [Paracoccaceae bacterium]